MKIFPQTLHNSQTAISTFALHVWNKSNLSCMTILWRSKHSHSRCKLHTKTILNVNVCTRQQKRDGLVEHMKVKKLAFKNCNVASRLWISRLWRRFTIWRKFLFLGVLFRKFSYQRWKYSRQTGRRDTLVFASRQRRQRANYLFTLHSVLSWLKPKWRNAVIAKTHIHNGFLWS